MSQSHNVSFFQPCLETFTPETRKLKRFYPTQIRHFGLLDSFHRTQIQNTRMYSLLQVEVPLMNRVHTAYFILLMCWLVKKKLTKYGTTMDSCQFIFLLPRVLSVDGNI
jgi:hypothetical protein